MSLEGDLMLPPRGPMKWRWLSSIIEKISRAANLISPDDSVVISPTTPGLSLRTPAQAAFDDEASWAAVPTPNSTNWTMIGGDVIMDGVTTHTIPNFQFTYPASFRILAVRIELDLTPTGELLTPRFFDLLGEYTVSSVAMELVTKETMEAARSVLPGSRNTGTIYVPVATLNPFQQIIGYGIPITLYIYHQDFRVF